MRIVLDTNVLAAGPWVKVPAAEVLDLWIEGRFYLLTSEAQLAELKRILQTKLKAHISPVRRAQLLAQLRKAAILIQPKRRPRLSPDPDDNLILAIALEGQADALVTGDKGHLLSLKVRGLRIASVRQFLAEVS